MESEQAGRSPNIGSDLGGFFQLLLLTRVWTLKLFSSAFILINLTAEHQSC